MQQTDIIKFDSKKIENMSFLFKKQNKKEEYKTFDDLDKFLDNNLEYEFLSENTILNLSLFEQEISDQKTKKDRDAYIRENINDEIFH